ncbi:peptidoglycan-binding protein [Rosenbergiella metrosideri]|uniref:peptidoglycan-binding protein n=1 Tax=Rosenbergiella metrosideri TaxID=2921185 RepID=UPI001F4F185A|nr:peptidoglycan-binding protein [Rosenbergiella metrosideri]
MLLEDSVGLNANTKYSDVIIIKNLLVKHGFNLRIDGICRNNTISAIRTFQSRMKLLPDARVDINGKTIKFLEKKKNNLIKISPQFSEGIGAKYDVATMELSQAGVRLLADYEQLRLKIYDDQTGKEIKHYTPGTTIGYGHLIVDTKEFERYKEGISASQALS